MEQVVDANKVLAAVEGVDYKKVKTGRRGGRWQIQTGASKREINHRNLSTHGYFPWRWRARKERKLGQCRDDIVKGFLTKLVHHSQHGMPKNPGPLPTLLSALGAIGADYLEPWETLRHPAYTSWLTDHLDGILSGSEWRQFVMWAEAAISRLQGDESLQVISSESDPEASTVMSNIIQVQINALQEVTDVIIICKSDMGDNMKATHIAKMKGFRDEAIQYMKIAAEFYWMASIMADPTEAVHEQVVFKFYHWKLSDDGMNDKKRNGRQGFQYRQIILANLGIKEESDQGRFEDAEKASSDDDEDYKPAFHRFDFGEEIKQFLETDKIAKWDGSKLAQFHSTIKEFFAPLPELSENEQQKKVLVPRCTTQYSGRSNWQMRLDKWRLAAAAQGRNLAEHEDTGTQQTKDFLEGEASGEAQLACHPQAPESGKASAVKIDAPRDAPKSSKGKRPRSDSEDLSAKIEQFDIVTATKVLKKSLVPFSELDKNIQLMSLCFRKEKDTVGNRVSFTLDERELQQRSRFKTLSFATEIASKYDPANFMCQPQGRQECLRHLLRETLQRKNDESKTRVRWFCKEVELEIERITEAVQKAVDAIP